MPTYSINIVTVDRQEQGRRNYLEATMRSLAQSGIFERDDFEMTLWDSGSAGSEHLDAALGHVPEGRTVLVERPRRRLTKNENFCRALTGGADRARRYVLMLEDDLAVVGNWLGSIDRWLDRYFDDSEFRLASFYTPYDEVERIWVATRHRVGWWRYPVEKFYGTLCFATRPSDARGIAATVRRVASHTGASDIFMKEYFRPEEHFLASVPSFVQHIGVESSIHVDAPERTCPCFPGEDWTW